MNEELLRKISSEMAEQLYEYEGVYVMNKEEIFQFINNRLETEGISKEKKQPNVLMLYIGDWSDDGHGKCQDFYITSNYPVETIQQAYKDTCKKIGLQLHHGENSTGLPDVDGYGSWRQLATEYEENKIPEEAMEILVQRGCSLSGEPLTMESEPYMGPEDMFELFMWFVSYSMPEDFQYEKLEAEAVNGWGNLNVQIGYGCFY